jgi:hypothetical protein
MFENSIRAHQLSLRTSDWSNYGRVKSIRHSLNNTSSSNRPYARDDRQSTGKREEID